MASWQMEFELFTRVDHIQSQPIKNDVNRGKFSPVMIFVSSTSYLFCLWCKVRIMPLESDHMIVTKFTLKNHLNLKSLYVIGSGQSQNV